MQEPLNLQDAIFNLQKYLRALSFVDERITRPPLDGIFDSATEEAVRSFQNAYGVGSNGLVDKATWDAIYEEYKAIDDYAELPFFQSAPESYTAKLGEESAFVGIIQVILRELSSLYDLFSNVEVNGIYDTATENAIRELQRASGLKITGELDKPTYKRLLNDFYAHSYF